MSTTSSTPSTTSSTPTRSTQAGPAVFTGWPADATAFLGALAADASSEFWLANRHRYAAAVLPPMQAMSAELESEFGPARILRPHRDRRFRRDAPPLRTDTGAVVVTPGGSELSVVLSAAALSVRAGRHLFEGATLRGYRAAVAARPGETLAALLAELAAAGLVLGPVDRLVTRPRGVPADHPRLELLRLRSLHVGRSWPVGPWLGTHEPLTRVAGAWRAARPLVAWLDEHAPA